MSLRLTAVFITGAVLAASAPAFARTSDKAEPHTAAAVQAADEAWGAVEEHGDKAYVEWLLLPGYRSVNWDGKSTDKAIIVSRTGAPRYPDRAAKVAKWKADHPEKPMVEIFGDTAVLVWTAGGASGGINSCDIFAYRDGHWHAVYSQHTKVDGSAGRG
ncbi:MAG TPA: hypothetical protein VFE18_18735 [Phenylobacterium sp.]|jgi:hypothetical protein|uniref:hypothetical protein n=1 Tax=Phenylobacterium sp. TaxID=1871053 RepID=UPI002D535002|nr:hypothetical protein [Phenylobacterium sp.]HZZ70215.1 hypothetical protein [Phenylobacterium sp.]